MPVTSSPSPLTFTLICYNSLGQRTLIVSDMNLNSQIDWNDTDRIVSNDTRYVSLNGDWWRESSTWQTRQNGSPALTRVGLTRTRLTGLGGNTIPSASSPTGAGTGLLTAVAPAEVLPDMSYCISDTMSIRSDPCAPLVRQTIGVRHLLTNLGLMFMRQNTKCVPEHLTGMLNFLIITTRRFLAD